VASNHVASEFWLNDLNEPLVQLLELIIENPQEIITAYTEIWHGQHHDSVTHYFETREKFNLTNDPRLFLYLLARCVKGAVRYNSAGLFNQSPDKRRNGAHPDKMSKNIEGVSILLKGRCHFTSLDYQEVLVGASKNDFIYMDPPYQGVCGQKDSRYFSGISFDDFVLSLEQLNRRGIAFAISYDGKRGDKTFGTPLPKELGLQRIEIEVGRSSQATLLGRTEITTESLYLSPNLANQHVAELKNYRNNLSQQLTLLENHGKFSAVTR
jgi:DNA adenine methylase